MSTRSTVSSLLPELTLDEKASLCLGSDFWHTAPVPRLDIPAITLSDGPHGLRHQSEAGYHVGIGGSLPATCFPTASALRCSFDPDLVRRVGELVGEAARAQRVEVVLGPGINIKRSPLCGRSSRSSALPYGRTRRAPTCAGSAAAVRRPKSWSETEQRVAALVADGRSNKAIAAELYISVRTVESHLSHVYRKTGVRSRVQLTRHLMAAEPGAKDADEAAKVQ